MSFQDYLRYSQIAAYASWAYQVDHRDSYSQVVEMGDWGTVGALVGGVVAGLGEIRSLTDEKVVSLGALFEVGDEITPRRILNFLLTNQSLSENGGIAVFALHRDGFKGATGADMVGKVLKTNYKVVEPKRMPVILVDSKLGVI